MEESLVNSAVPPGVVLGVETVSFPKLSPFFIRAFLWSGRYSVTAFSYVTASGFHSNSTGALYAVTDYAHEWASSYLGVYAAYARFSTGYSEPCQVDGNQATGLSVHTRYYPYGGTGCLMSSILSDYLVCSSDIQSRCKGLLPVGATRTGYRYTRSGVLGSVSAHAYEFSSCPSGLNSCFVDIFSTSVYPSSGASRGEGLAVRCIQAFIASPSGKFT